MHSIFGSAGLKNKRVCHQCLWQYHALLGLDGFGDADAALRAVNFRQISDDLGISRFARLTGLGFLKSRGWANL